MKKLWLALIPLLILSPFLYVGIFIDREWLKYLGISILICSPAIVIGIMCMYDIEPSISDDEDD